MLGAPGPVSFWPRESAPVRRLFRVWRRCETGATLLIVKDCITWACDIVSGVEPVWRASDISGRRKGSSPVVLVVATRPRMEHHTHLPDEPFSAADWHGSGTDFLGAEYRQAAREAQSGTVRQNRRQGADQWHPWHFFLAFES